MVNELDGKDGREDTMRVGELRTASPQTKEGMDGKDEVEKEKQKITDPALSIQHISPSCGYPRTPAQRVLATGNGNPRFRESIAPWRKTTTPHPTHSYPPISHEPGTRGGASDTSK
jgi:hypothetical protein